MRNTLCEETFELSGRLIVRFGLAVLVAAGASLTSIAETYTVTEPNGLDSGNDDVGEYNDEVPGDGHAEIHLGSGRTSLRSAIQESNQLPGRDTIILDVEGGQLSLRIELPPLTDPAGVVITTKDGAPFVLDCTTLDDRLLAYVNLISSGFAELDQDDDELLTFGEAANLPWEDVREIIHNLSGLRQVDFNTIDTNDDNRIDAQELEDYKPSEVGLRFHSPNNVLENVTFDGVPGNAIEIRNEGSDGNLIQNCKILASGGIGLLIGENASDNTIQGCVIADSNNHGIHLFDGASRNLIGGASEGQGNFVTGSGTTDVIIENEVVVAPEDLGHGILIEGPGTDDNIVHGNHIGVDEDLQPASNAFSGLVIANGASGNLIGGSEAGEGNTISNNGDSNDGCPDACGNGARAVYGYGILIDGFPLDNVSSTDNIVMGNQVNANHGAGIRIQDTVGNQIGGLEEGAGNTTNSHGNTYYASTGILLDSAVDVLVAGNHASGNHTGLYMSNARESIIGSPEFGNVLNGNTRGLEVSGGRDNVIQSNRIGIGADDTKARNTYSGMYVSGTVRNLLIGGTEPDTANIISGNSNNGIVFHSQSTAEVFGEPDVFVYGNLIGTNSDGTIAVPNDVNGILLDNGARNVKIGGTEPGQPNVISGNGNDGIRVARSPGFIGLANNIWIYGNAIGTNAARTSLLGNVSSGVSVFEGGNEVYVGGIGEGEANVIAGNGQFGVRVKGGSLEVTHEITIRGNAIYANETQGIELEDGANDGLAAPVISLLGPVRGTAPANTTIDLYADAGDQGRFHLGTGASDGAGNFTVVADLSGLSVNKLTATATNAAGSTSEFSAPFAIVPPSITTHPTAMVVVEGEPFTLSTVAEGSAPLSYQWQYVPTDGGEFENIINSGIFNGATTATLNNTGARLVDQGNYRCLVTNAVDSVSTAVVLVDVVEANTDTAEVSTLEDTLDGDTTSPAHIFADPGADGVISLREAIIAANNRAGADTISFSVSGTITIESGLPSLTDTAGGTTINGGGNIILDGTGLGGVIGALRLDSADNVLDGLGITNFPGIAVAISGAGATGNMVTGCAIGTNGTNSLGNGGHGIELSNGATDNLIGGTDASDRNVISGNDGSGVYITDAGTQNNIVIGNYIGVSENGLASIANGGSGVSIVDGASANQIGGKAAGEGNVLSANVESGVLLSGDGTTANVVSGNLIGLNATAVSGLGNVENGVTLIDGAAGNQIGGATVDEIDDTESAAGNTISGNAGAAVLVEGALTVDNTIRFNAITGNFGTGIELADGGNTGLAAPVITGLGSIDGTALPGTTVDLYASDDQQGETYLATVVADGDGNFTSPVEVEALNGLFITATATDATGNTSAFSEGFFVDLEPPVITLLGEPIMTVQCGTPFTDPGATAEDDVDGNITGSIVKTITFEGAVTGAVNTSVLGTYEILYEVSDNAGQEATPVVRTVEVVDTTAPVITLNGSETVSLECGAVYTEAGATATDACDGDLEVTIVGTVNADEPGVYPVLYRVTDAQGNAAVEVTRTVTVADTTLPVITVLGNLAVTLECGVPYLDAGATVTDACDSGVTLETDNPVEPGTPGVYTVLYDATDASGNAAGQAFRTVTVVDTTPPTITLLGASDLTVECGLPYNEPGASVTDTCESDLDFIVMGTVNTSAPGNYTLVYSASDSAGNVADTVTRIVRVADNARPVVTLVGAATVNVECGGTYVEAGATASDSCEGDLSDAVVISGSVNTAVAGSYTINYDVTDSVGNQATRVSRTVVVAVCPAPCEDQCAGDPDDAIDEDGDGISACVESCLGTSDALIDSDSDGVPDNIEIDNGTDPVVPDSDLDLDGDGLTQLEEFIFDSDALDPNSPSVSFFVSPGGADSVGGGDANSPWGTIAYAIAQSGASEVNPVRIILADGNYPEDVELIPGVTLVGAVDALPRIEGTIFGANNSGLINIEVAAFTDDDVMLVMDDVAMTLVDVLFRGSAARPAAGILADGARTADSTIDGCHFVSLSIGIDVGGALPVIRRCTFEDTTIAGVFVRETATIGDGASLGDVDDPSTGSNLFSGVTEGRAIINELDETLLAQQNDWGTTDLDAIEANLVSGPVTVDPVLAPGSAANTASLYVTVWRATNQARISNASVTATTAGGASVTVGESRNGVYSLSFLRADSYTIGVSADGFETQTLSVVLAPGELGSRIVALQVPEEKEGGPSCHGGSEGGAGFGVSDLMIVAFLLGGLFAGTRISGAQRRSDT